jgi:hypothetical protein
MPSECEEEYVKDRDDRCDEVVIQVDSTDFSNELLDVDVEQVYVDKECDYANCWKQKSLPGDSVSWGSQYVTPFS